MERERRTPEQDDEDERDRVERFERAIDHADRLRDEAKDRRMEDLWAQSQEHKRVKS